jgi:hypothetical protein
VPALALIPGVKWIAEKTYAKLDASVTNPATIPMVLQNNGVYTTTTATGWKLWNAGIDGTGQIVTMMDSGLNTKMEHFSQDVLNNGVVGPAHRRSSATTSTATAPAAATCASSTTSARMAATAPRRPSMRWVRFRT